jgi:hypothetical protein
MSFGIIGSSGLATTKEKERLFFAQVAAQDSASSDKYQHLSCADTPVHGASSPTKSNVAVLFSSLLNTFCKREAVFADFPLPSQVRLSRHLEESSSAEQLELLAASTTT